MSERVKYDPRLPWGGFGSPCGNLPLQRRFAELHAEDSRYLPPVFVDFPGLADCRECEMCGGCEIHNPCATDLNHIEWFLRFASPGEPACGDAGNLSGRGTVCALRAGHGDEWHQERGGAGWRTK